MGELATQAQEVEQRQDPAKGTVLDLIRQQKGAIDVALPQHVTPERFTRVVLTEVHRNKNLLNADPMSLLAAVMLSAQLGLELGPLGHAYLVPYKRQITFIIGYQGMIDLARRSGQVAYIQAYEVRENDEFSYHYGLHPDITHVPAEGDRGEITHVYAVAKYRDGGFNMEVLTVSDVDRFKSRSASARATHSPWQSDYAAMAKKTAIRRLWPWLPKTPEMIQVSQVDETQVPGSLTPSIAQSLEDLALTEGAGDAGDDGDDENVTDAELVDDEASDSGPSDEETKPETGSDEAWAKLADRVAEVPTGSKQELVSATEKLIAELEAVSLDASHIEVPSEKSTVDVVEAAVARAWAQGRDLFAEGGG